MYLSFKVNPLCLSASLPSTLCPLPFTTLYPLPPSTLYHSLPSTTLYPLPSTLCPLPSTIYPLPYASLLTPEQISTWKKARRINEMVEVVSQDENKENMVNYGGGDNWPYRQCCGSAYIWSGVLARCGSGSESRLFEKLEFSSNKNNQIFLFFFFS